MSAIGDEIRRARRERGMSQRELAQATGTGERTIGRLERGEAGDDPRSLERVQKFLQLGEYAPDEVEGSDVMVALRKATVPQLLGALGMKWEDAVREAAVAATAPGIRVSSAAGGDTPQGERLATGRVPSREGDTAS